MAPEKVTVMILDVDLKCCSCYKKVKKVLCKFPQIRDQVFDEEKNKVRITVVCCNPERIREKLCCKGGKAIQRIEIVEDKPKDPKKPKPQVPEKKPSGKVDKPKPDPNPPPPKPDPPKPEPVRMPNPCHGYPPPRYPPVCPVPVCCTECYEGRDGGPCQYWYGRIVPPPPGPCYDGFGYGYGCQYGGNRPCYVSRCDCLSEKNPQGCSIM